jgi:membrane associated rhomboid family serine protease
MSPPLLPPVVRALLIANTAVFLLEQVAYDRLLELFALWPFNTPYFRPWQLVSYAFLHISIAHLAVNMFGLWLFGRPLEQLWGSRRCAFYYLGCILSAAATHLVLQNDVAIIGASGGVFGLLLGYAWYFRSEEYELRLYPIPLPVWLLATIYSGIELYLGVTGKQPGVAHFAHLGGILGGTLAILYWQARKRFRDRTAS